MSEASSSQPGLRRLARLRLRLTVWYVGTLSLIVVLLGGGLFVVISSQFSQQLDKSLQTATTELIRAARIRELEAKRARGEVVDAVDELYIPERVLYLMDVDGRPIKPAKADSWISATARKAAGAPHGQATVQNESPDDKTLRAHAQRFSLRSGRRLVAVAVADRVELEDRYADLIAAFAGTAVAALVLVAGGGFLLVGKSTAPIDRSLLFMRRFMADAAHELRTPITVLRTRAEVALQQPRDAEGYAAALTAIEAESRRLGALVDSLLALARADAGERPLQREKLFLDDIAIDAAGAEQIIAGRKGVRLIVEDFEETAIDGDAVLVRQLMMILLDNAVKFTDPGGEVRVRIAVRQGAPTFVVEDTGIGIRPEDLPRVFERFFRADVALSRSQGAGLGLSIAAWIAQEHGAEISMESKPGAGTRALVTFPRPASET